MQFAPDDLWIEQRILLIEKASTDDVLMKITGREEINLQPHAHNKFQIIYILSGTLHIEVDGINHFVTDQHLVWIPSGVSHRLSSNNRQISLLVGYFYTEDFTEKHFAVYRTDELIVRNLQLIASYDCINKQQTPEIYAFSIGFFRLLPHICKKAVFSTQPFVLIKDNRLLPILDYIKSNLNQDLTIEQVASTFGFSVRNLTRLFTNSGIRFVYYLNYQRIVRAIEILADNVMNIEQTAYEVGFNSPNSFSRVFKQITGMSPLTFIKK